ncbi:hypothetical protein ACD592_07295 [Rhizobium sp. 969_B3_N1_2]|uniref:hypothetical protein n=1 Tax=Rhizobium sp. 969_B3_N1_2 TaxID=3276278 RepID=UPI003F273A43
MTKIWQRDEAEARIREVLDAAKAYGSQTVIDRDGTYAIVFTHRKQGLEKLFSKPGPLCEGDL